MRSNSIFTIDHLPVFELQINDTSNPLPITFYNICLSLKLHQYVSGPKKSFIYNKFDADFIQFSSPFHTPQSGPKWDACFEPSSADTFWRKNDTSTTTCRRLRYRRPCHKTSSCRHCRPPRTSRPSRSFRCRPLWLTWIFCRILCGKLCWVASGNGHLLFPWSPIPDYRHQTGNKMCFN